MPTLGPSAIGRIHRAASVSPGAEKKIIIIPGKGFSQSSQSGTKKGAIPRRGGEGFPRGSVVKNLPAKTRDASLIPGLGRCHM